MNSHRIRQCRAPSLTGAIRGHDRGWTDKQRGDSPMADDEFHYSSGFGNEFVTEAVAGALPAGRNSPQRPPLGLYAEQLSGTAFTQPRAVNRRTWVYRIMPSAAHPRFDRIGHGTLRGTPFDEIEPDPNRLRWNALPVPDAGTDFVDGLYT